MAEEEALRSSEESALDNNQITTNFSGGKSKNGKKGKISKGVAASAFIVLLIALFVGIFSSGNLMIDWIAQALKEATDVQYADAMMLRALIVQHALSDKNEEIPQNTAEMLRENGVLIGDMENGTFVESKDGSSIQFNGKVIKAEDFMTEVHSDAALYDAFNKSTYSRSAYYYDEDAELAFQQLGVSRDNFSGDETFEEIMEEIMGEGSNIMVTNGETSETMSESEAETKPESPTENENNESNNSSSENSSQDSEAQQEEITDEEEEGEDEEKDDVCREVQKDGKTVKECDETKTINFKDAESFIKAVGAQNKSQSNDFATLNAADTLTLADSITEEQRSVKFYVAMMENIDKTKAGYGGESRINDMMNFLYRNVANEVVDVETGKIITVEGSMLESPSLYSILTKERLDVSKVANYSSEKILHIVGNRIDNTADMLTFQTTIAASDDDKGEIGRWMDGSNGADTDALLLATKTISDSMVNNGFKTIGGITGGEFFVKGAINTGAALARRSGSSLGDEDEIKKYGRVSNTILALDAEADRLNRSPFDITSKNTFLGSLLFKFAVSSSQSGSLLNKVASFSKVTASSIMSLFPMANADDEETSYMTTVGECDRLDMSVFAAGTATCQQNQTFDTSNYKELIFYNDKAKAVLDRNVRQRPDGTWEIIEGSDFEKFAKYNVERTTVAGAVDGIILEDLNNGESETLGMFDLRRVFNNFMKLIGFYNNGESGDSNERRLASGEVFVNTFFNDEWETTYKYAQGYFSAVRALNNLRSHDGDKTAYGDIPYVGYGNPVLALYERLHQEAIAATND